MKKFLSVLAACAMLPFAAWAGEDVTYSVKGESFEGYYAKSLTGASKGLVLIIHDWDGLTEYEKKRANMLAGLGYDAFAVDIYGKGKRPTDIKGNKAMSGALYKDRARMRALLLGGLEAARKSSTGKAVVMGYCFGGAAALELARSGKAGNVSGFVSFHGGLSTPKGQSYPKSTPPLLIAHGGADKVVPMSQVASLAEELEAGKIAYEIQVYSGAPHAFTHFGSKRYRETADMQSWDAFQDFLKANLGG